MDIHATLGQRIFADNVKSHAHMSDARRAGARFASAPGDRFRTKRMRIATLVFVIVAAAGSTASAQLDPRLKVGARVRVERPDAQIVGRVAEVRGDTIVVDRGPADSPMTVPLSDVTALAVYTRGKGAEKAMAVLGTLGALTGAALYVSWCVKDPEWCREAEPVDTDPYDDEVPPSLFATMTIGFGAIGLLLGHSFAPLQWQVIDPAIRVGLTPTSSGFAAYVSIPAPRFVPLRR